MSMNLSRTDMKVVRGLSYYYLQINLISFVFVG
jgi:hypothetical protein